MNRQVTLFVLVTAFLAALAGPASAVHWGNFGGDPGRSSNQTVDVGTVPVKQAYVKAEATVRGTPIITGHDGSVSDALFAYGTGSNGHFHHQYLLTGAPLDTEAGLDIQDGGVDSNSYGTSSTGVSAVDSSPEDGGPGITFVVHNDDNQDGSFPSPVTQAPDPRTGGDIALAAISQEDGDQLGDTTIGPVRPSATAGREKANTIEFDINSSPVLGPDDGTGTRALFFTAARTATDVDPAEIPCNPAGDFEDAPGMGGENARGCSISSVVRLFKINIHDAADPVNMTWTNDDVTAVDVPTGNHDASVALIQAGTTLLVAVPTEDGFVRTYKAADLTAGPVSPDLSPSITTNAVQTPAVPIPQNGDWPTPQGEMFVAVQRASGNSLASRVTKLTVTDAAITIADPATDESYDFGALPGPSLAVSNVDNPLLPGGSPGPGRVIATMANDLYSFNTDNLKDGAEFFFVANGAAGTTGFGRTGPSVSGDLVYVQNDQGDQMVLDQTTLDPVSAAEFAPHAGQTPAANEAIGQPAISRGFVLFPNSDGVFAYRNQNAPTVTITSPVDTNPPTVVFGPLTITARAFNERSGVAKVVFKSNGNVIGEDTSGVGPTNTAANGGAEFSITVDSRTLGNGLHTLTAEAVDQDSGFDAPAEVGVSQPVDVTVNNAQGTTFTIDDQTIAEGDSGTKTVTFTVTKTGPAGAAVTASTADGTATAPADYTAAGPTVLTFAAADTTKTFQVTVKGDTTPETDEVFKVKLTNATNGTGLADPEGTGLITDEESGPGQSAPVLLASDAVVVEGDTGTVNAVFNVSLSSAPSTPVTVSYATRNDTATAGVDYNATTGSLTFAPGQPITRTVLVPVRGDRLNEDPERYQLVLANPANATLADGIGVGTIIDNEKLPGTKDPVAPRGLSAKTTPARDTKAPFRFTTKGLLTLPSSVTRAEGCGIGGQLDIQVKALRKTISTRRVKLKSDCTYSSTVSFRDAKRFTKSGVLTFTARFRGNKALLAIKAKPQNVRTK